MLRLNYIKERRVYARHIQNRVMEILIILIIIGIIIVVSMVKTCNKVRGMKVKIDEAQSDMESYLIKRYDVLTESVKAIGDFKEYEQGIMENIIKHHLNMTKDEFINKHLKWITVNDEGHIRSVITDLHYLSFQVGKLIRKESLDNIEEEFKKFM